MKYIFSIIILLFFINEGTFSQGKAGYTEGISSDSIIKITGHVYDSATHEGIRNAKITYEKLPYGNYIGVTRAENEEGYYEYETFGNEQYHIVVNAPNYKAVSENIDPFQSSGTGMISRDYYLAYLPEEGEVIRLENLIFELGRSEIQPESFEELDRLVDQMNEYPGMIIQLEGHTDFRGGKSKNFKLSQERVIEVKKYLISKGIDTDRIMTKAYGGSRPISRKASEEAARLNRRVEVRIIKR